MGEIHLYIYRIYPVPTQGSICASVRDDQTSWTPKPDTFLVENHNSHRYDLSPPATTEHLRNATWDLKYPTMFMIFTLNLKFLHRRDFFNKHSDTYQPWIRLVPILFLFCDRQYLYIGETEKSLQKGVLFKTVSANSDGRGRTFVKVVYQKFNGQFTLACGPAVLDT